MRSGAAAHRIAGMRYGLDAGGTTVATSSLGGSGGAGWNETSSSGAGGRMAVGVCEVMRRR